MERWWNIEITFVTPFDTKAEAMEAMRDPAWDDAFDALARVFPGTVMWGSVKEAPEDD